MRVKWISALVAITAVQLIIGCGEKPSQTAPADTNKPAPTETKAAPAGPKTAETGDAVKGFEEAEKTNRAKLTIEDPTPGTGQMVQKGDFALMEYTGTLDNGSQFDSNAAVGGVVSKPPFSFFVGGGSVIQGWDLGIPGMKVGGVRKLTIPAELGYGAQGSGEKIPGGSTLHFTVKLVDVVKSGEEQVYDSKTITPGTGTEEVKKGDTITVEYVTTMANGYKVDSSADHGGTYTFKVGEVGKVIAGFDAGVMGMKVGEKRHLRIPPLLAYGMNEGRDMGRSGPPLERQTLMLDVVLKKIQH